MKEYSYRAIHKSGDLHKGILHAENENELTAILARKGLELIDAKDKGSKRTRRSNNNQNTEDKIHFSNQMEDLLNAGLPFSKGLALVIQNTDKGQTKDQLTNIENAVRSGASITESLAAQKKWFDPVAVAILKSGEESGKMGQAFARLNSHFIKQKAFRDTLLRAIRYPLFLMMTALSVTSFMMIWVVPQIIEFLLNQGNELPTATKLLIHTAQLFETLWWLLPVSGIGLTAFIICARRLSHKALCRTDKWLLKTPFLGTIWYKLALARMMDSMALLLQSGVAVSETMQTSVLALNNHHMIEIAQHSQKELLEGKSLSESLRPLLTPFLSQRIEVGESSNQLPKTIEAIALNLDKEARGTLTTFLAALEPALTMLVGGLMIWVVLAVLGPLYASLGPLSGGM